VQDHAGRAQWVVFADIKNFFESIRFGPLLHAAEDLVGPDASAQVGSLLLDFETIGIDSLPSGYCDTRMLANLYLHVVDKTLDVPFVRWVDDYRIFVPSGQRPDAVVDALSIALARIGLSLNQKKTRIVEAHAARDVEQTTLASAYHPERDSPDRVRANLYRLFGIASANPVDDRRTLRFAIARLARERDPAAVDFVLGHFEVLPWEAPRFSAYLASVVDDPRVAPGVDRLLARALEARDEWLVSRLAALGCHMGCSDGTAGIVGKTLPTFAGTPAWGVCLRLLARMRSAGVRRHIERHWDADPRAAVVASGELAQQTGDRLACSAPVITSATERSAAPLPQVDSAL
jgi:hypothetical protein